MRLVDAWSGGMSGIEVSAGDASGWWLHLVV